MPLATLRVRDQVLDLSMPRVMGILNATPDSFSDGGAFNDLQPALDHIEQMVAQGASIIDIGGESTRPGADPVPEQEELERVIPLIAQAVPKFPETLFSIDTTKYAVAEAALEHGVHIVNDVSGLQQEPRLADLCARFDAGYVLMHTQGNPETMQDDPTYNNVVQEITDFFKAKISQLKSAGAETLILDPGFGFGKTQTHNIAMLQELESFVSLGYPVLAGISRKSMVGRILGNRPTNKRLAGTIAVHYQALLNGASIIRVHDVQEAHDSIQIFDALRTS